MKTVSKLFRFSFVSSRRVFNPIFFQNSSKPLGARGPKDGYIFWVFLALSFRTVKQYHTNDKMQNTTGLEVQCGRQTKINRTKFAHCTRIYI